METWGDRLYHLSITSVFAITGFSLGAIGFDSQALAQNRIVPDNTLGDENSQINREIIRGIESDRISGGARRGQNLFHSFEQFDVGEGLGAYFDNPEAVQNIFSRVTGSDRSEILGRLGVLGDANLFFMNPNGILFGPNASLDITGSFFATTADSIQFGEAGVFSATNPEAPAQLLTINPSAYFFNYLDPQSGTISNTGNLQTGQDLTLKANDLNLQGQLFAGRNLTLHAIDHLRIRDSASNPFVAAANNQLLVQGNQTVDIFALNHPNSGLVSGEDMILRSSSQVGGDAHYWSGGNFRIEQLNGELGNLYSPYDPIIRVVGDLELGNYLGASLHILAGGSVTIPGVVSIIGSDTTGAALTETVTLSDGTVLAIDGITRPTVDIRAGVEPAAIGSPLGLVGDGLFPITGTVSDTATSADISIGYIGIAAPDGVVYLTNQYQPNSALAGGVIAIDGEGFLGLQRGIDVRSNAGNGGSVVIDSRNNIAIPNSIRTASSAGNSGDITLLADGDVILTNDGFLRTNTLGSGDAGNISIDAGGLVSISGANTGLLSNVTSDAVGQGGNITIRAGSLSLSDNALIVASTLGNGDAGRIVIDVDDAVSLDSESYIFSSIGEDAIGDTGGIEIRGRSLSLSDGSQITIGNIGGSGNLGNLFIETTDSVALTGEPPDLINRSFGTLIGNRLERGSSGRGGDVIINTGSLFLTSSQISASTFGTGDAGDVLINARDTVALTRDSGIFSGVDAGGIGNGGEIRIDAGSLLIDQSLIQSIVRGAAFGLAAGRGNAGNITVNLSGNLEIVGTISPPSVYPGIITAIANGVTETATDGDLPTAGNIRITAQDVVMRGRVQLRSVLDFDSVGEAGNIDVQSRSLTMSDAAEITTATVGQGNAGNINLRMTDGILLSNDAVISSGVVDGGNGNSGSINLQAGSLSVSGGQILTSVGRSTIGLEGAPPAEGNAGDITVRVRGAATFDGFTSQGNRSGIRSSIISEQGESGGNITLQSDSLLLNNGAELSSSTEGLGQAGDITINTEQLTALNESGVESTTNSSAAAGSIRIDTNNLVLRNGSYLFVDALEDSSGQAGNLTVNATDSIEIVGTAPNLNASGLYAQTRGSGDAGELRVATGRLSLRDGGTISAETSGSGNGGNLIVNATDSIEILGGSPDQSFSSSIGAGVEENASGNAGSVTVTTGELTLRDGGFISSSAEANSTGNAGSVTVNASESIEIVGTSTDNDARTAISVAVDQGATGNSGNLTIDTQRLNIRDGAGILAQNFGSGGVGSIQINADSIEVIGGNGETSIINATAGFSATGQPGRIQISTGTLRLGDSGQVVTNTFGQVDAGDIRIRASESIDISGGSPDGVFPSGILALTIPVVPGKGGQGGSIDIRTGNLGIFDGGQIAASTFGRADAGNIFVQADNIFFNRGFILTTVNQGAIGQGGNINIRTGSLDLNNRSQISSSTNGRGNTGEIFVFARDGIELNNRSRITSTVGSEAVGNSQNITLRTPELLLNDRSQLSAATSGQGDAGNIFIQNAELVSLSSRSSISTEVNQGAIGRGGNIDIETNNLTVDDAQITASTEGQGRAGNLTLTADMINLNNRGQIIASTSTDRRAGDITLTTTDLNLNNRARISARSTGTGQAGDIEINASGLIEFIDSDIETIATNSFGGNINVNTVDSDSGRMILHGDSDITTNSRDDGGNITLRATSIVAFDDSDILARSEAARGGNIDLQTDAFFGEDYQSGVDGAGNLDGNSRVDVNADGELASGTITTPDTSFIQNSLSELPESAIDSDALLANSCVVRSQNQSGTFTITGTGGLPQRPGDAPFPAYPTNSVRSVAEDAAGDDRSWQMGDPIVEPQGMYQLEDGRMVLSRECL